jgi:hypothetical protein
LTYTIPYDNFFKNNRSGLKTSDQVQGQGAGRSRKRSPLHILTDEHLPEACNPPSADHWASVRRRRIETTLSASVAGERRETYLAVVNDMDDNEKNPEEEKKPSSAGKKLHLDLSEAMTTSIDDDDDIIELKDEVTLPPKEKGPEIDSNDHLLPEFSPEDSAEASPEPSPEALPEASIDKPAEETLDDLEALSIEFDEHENKIQGNADLFFEEEDEEDVEMPAFAAEKPPEAEDANEVMEITEFDDIVSEDDNEMLTLTEDHKESEPEEEFLELIEVEEDRLPEAADEKIEEEIIQFEETRTDVEDIELENFINDSLNEEIQIGDELEDDLMNSLGIEAGPELSLTDKTSATEEFNFNVNTSEISEKIDQLDNIFFDETQSETEYDDETPSDNEDGDIEIENEDIRITDVDSLEQPPSDVPPSGLGVNLDQIEQSIEQFIEQNYSEKIESMITAIIEKAVAKEINRLKNVLLEDNSTEDL